MAPFFLILASAAAFAQTPGELAAAEQQYESLSKREPTAVNFQRLGLARFMQNKYESAIAPLREAARLNPKLWTADLFLGMSLYRLNQFPQASESLERAARLAPPQDRGRDDVDYWLGAVRIALRRPLAGLASLERLLARNPKHTDALLLAAQTYADFSSQLWNQVAEDHFETPQGYEVHAHALEEEGNVVEALAAYRHSKALGPKRVGPGAGIGRMLLRQGKADEAFAVLQKESSTEAAFYCGLALIQLERPTEAAPYLERAAAAFDPEPSIALAQVFLALGEKEKAARAARRAVDLAPESVAARELLEAALR